MKYTIKSNDTAISWGLIGSDRIAQNVLNIIRTRASEVPFLRDMGTNYDYIDSNINYLRTNIMNDIMEQIETYENRAEVLSVDIIEFDTDGRAVIQVEIEVA